MSDPVLCGIYGMYFQQIPDKFYIGLSADIYFRKYNHYNNLKNLAHINKELQKAYNLYGTPEFEILELCGIGELSLKEISWIKEFDSYANGFNNTGGGEHPFGENHPGALNTEKDYLEVVKLMAYTNLSLIDISNVTFVSYYTVRDISCGKAHKYIASLLPEAYSKMLCKSNTRSSKKYSDEVYVEVIHTLANTSLSMREVSDSLSVGYSVVRNIAYGSSHKYLADKYPEVYKLMRSKVRINKGGKWTVETL